jgi:hypothetical protein
LGERDEDGNLIKAHTEIQLPPVPRCFEYLLSFFFLSGQCIQTGMGISPLTWVEIESYIRVNELEVLLWEKELLKKMSEAYCAESHKATDPKRPAPYKEEKDEEEIDKMAASVKMWEQMQLLRGNRNGS